jgi:hypothetical protein
VIYFIIPIAIALAMPAGRAGRLRGSETSADQR